MTSFSEIETGMAAKRKRTDDLDDVAVQVKDRCLQCPWCGPNDAVYPCRSHLWLHVKKSHEGRNIPPTSDLKHVYGIKTGGSTGQWFPPVTLEPLQIQLSEHQIDFRSESKLQQRLNLALVVVPTPYPFEPDRTVARLKHYEAALKFITEIALIVPKANYFLRRCAKLQPDGTIPTHGFEVLSCKKSCSIYARTLARFLFFMEQKQGITLHPELLLNIAMKESESQQDFCVVRYLKLVYVCKPYGYISEDPDFLKHEAVRLLYCLRLSFISAHYSSQSNPSQSEHFAKMYLTEQKYCPFSALQNFKRVANLCIVPSAKDRLQISDDGEILVNNGNTLVPVTKHNLQMLFADLCSRASSLLLSLSIDPDWINPDQVVDSNSIRNCGDGIITANQHLFNAVCGKQPDFTRKMFHARPAMSETVSILKTVTDLGLVLLKLLHLCGGPGARMTEEAVWLVSNSSGGGDRNIRFIRKTICVVNTYSKADKQTVHKAPMLLVSFADVLVTKFVLSYLIIAKRIEEHHLESAFQHNSRAYFVIKNGKPLDGVKLGAHFRAYFLTQNLDIHISDFRHVLEGYARQFQVHLFSNPLILSANHSASTSYESYGLSNRDVVGVPADILQICALYSMKWNSICLGATSPSDLSTGSSVSNIEEQAPKSHSEKTALELQQVANHVRLVGQASQESNMRSPGPSVERKAQLLTCAVDHNQKTNLFHLFGLKDFKSIDQRQAYAFIKTPNPMAKLVILPTGAGKTLLYQLHAVESNTCTVLFVPFKLLAQQMISLDCSFCNVVDWSRVQEEKSFDVTASKAHILVCSFEAAITGPLVAMIQKLAHLNRLGFIAIDEVHCLVLDKYRQFQHFWTFIPRLKDALQRQIDVVCFTATLRPAHEPRLAKALNQPQMRVFRRSCFRPLQFNTLHFGNKEGARKSLLARLLREVELDHITVVFCLTIQETESLGDFLQHWIPQTVVNHSANNQFELFKKTGIMVSTTCAGFGLHVPKLRNCFIWENCWSIESLVQLAGRCGRDCDGMITFFSFGNEGCPHLRNILDSNPGNEWQSICDVIDRPILDPHTQTIQSVTDIEGYRKDIGHFQHLLLQLNSDYCILCHLLGFTPHSTSTLCTAKNNICLKCLRAGHGASQCTSRKRQPPQGFCSSCWLPTGNLFGCHNSLWGKLCNNVLADVTPLVAVIVKKRRRTNIIPSSLDENDFFDKWLWSGDRLPGVVLLLFECLKISAECDH